MADQSYDTAPSQVRAAIGEAARLTGESETFLARMAGRESAYNATAKAQTSSASGLFQITDGTWTGLTTRYGAKYGITGSTSRFDPRANAIMAAELARENRAALRASLGHAPTDGDMYVAHFLGAGEAGRFIKAAQADSYGTAATMFPAAAAANPTIFYTGKGAERRARTLGEVLVNLNGGFNQGTAPGSGDTSAAGGLPNTYGYEASPEDAARKLGFQEGVAMAAQQEQTQMMLATYAMKMGNAELAPDDDFRWTAELIRETTAGMPDDYAEWVVKNAQSRAQVDYYVDRAKQDMENEQTLGEQGWAANLGFRGIAIMTDIPTWLVGFGAGKLVAGARATKAVLAARAGFIAVAETVPAELAKMANRPSYGVDDALIAGTFAFALGGTFGAVFGKSGSDLDGAFMGAAARAEREGIERGGDTLTPTGADYYRRMEAQSGGSAATPVEMRDPGIDTSFVRKMDISTVGGLMRSANPEVRTLAHNIDIDAVGDGGMSLRPDETAFEYARRSAQAAETEVARPVNDAFEAWAKDKGLPLQKRIGEGREVFMREVADEIIQPTGRDLNVAAAADAGRGGFARKLREAKAAGADWAKAIDEDPNYFPMVFDRDAIRARVDGVGTDAVVEVIAKALRAAQKDADPKLLLRIAERYLKVIRGATDGTQSTVAHAISGLDTEALRALLLETGTDGVDVDAFLAAYKPVSKTGPKAFRRRTLLDANTAFDSGAMARGKSGKMEPVKFSVRDLTDMNFERVWEGYNRNISGQTAMVKAGFQTPGAYEASILKSTKGSVGYYPGYSDDAAAADYKALRFLGDAVYGRPLNNADPKVQQMVGIFGDWNFARVMGQSGVAQLGDVPKIFLNMGMKAAFTEFRLGDVLQVFRKGGNEADALVHQLEELTGVGTNRARNTIVPMYRGIDEFYGQTTATKALDHARRFSKTAANITGMVSGMTPIVDFLGRWATRASLRELVQITRGSRELAEKFLNDRALSPETLARFKKLVDAMDTNSGGGVIDMRIDKLRALDPEGLDKLGAYLSRQARKTVLEHSPGMLPMWAQSPLGRVVTQFRTFSMASHAANTLHNVRMGPAYAAKSVMVSGLWAGAVYALHQYTKSIGRPDQEEYLARVFEPGKFVASAYGRSADSGIMPTILDTLMTPFYAATGVESPFKYSRTSGLEQGILGIPAVDLGIDLGNAFSESIADPLRSDKRTTQADALRLAGLLPLNNTYVIANALKAVVRPLPKHEADE